MSERLGLEDDLEDEDLGLVEDVKVKELAVLKNREAESLAEGVLLDEVGLLNLEASFQVDLLTITFPVTCLNRLCGSLELVKGSGFGRLTENILDMIREALIVGLSESRITPINMSRKTVEFDIILQDALVVMHAEVVKIFFSITSRINGAKVHF